MQLIENITHIIIIFIQVYLQMLIQKPLNMTDTKQVTENMNSVINNVNQYNKKREATKIIRQKS